MTTLMQETGVRISQETGDRSQESVGCMPPEASLISYTEEYRCPACDSVIPHTCRKSTEAKFPQTRRDYRVVSIWCAQCNKGFTCTFTLNGGLLSQISGVTLLLGDDLARFRREIGAITGDVVQFPHDADRESRRAVLRGTLDELDPRLCESRARLDTLTRERARIAEQLAELDAKPATDMSKPYQLHTPGRIGCPGAAGAV